MNNRNHFFSENSKSVTKKNTQLRLQRIKKEINRLNKILVEHDFERSDISRELKSTNNKLIRLAKKCKKNKSIDAIQLLDKKIQLLAGVLEHLERKVNEILNQHPENKFLTCCQDEGLFIDLMRADPVYVSQEVAKLRHHYISRHYQSSKFDPYQFMAPFLQFSAEKLTAYLDPESALYKSLFGPEKIKDDKVAFDLIAIPELEPLYREKIANIKKCLAESQQQGYPYRKTVDGMLEYAKISEEIYIYKFMKSFLERFDELHELMGISDINLVELDENKKHLVKFMRKEEIEMALSFYLEGKEGQGADALFKIGSVYHSFIDARFYFPAQINLPNHEDTRTLIFGEKTDSTDPASKDFDFKSIDNMVFVPQFNVLVLQDFCEFSPGNLYPMGLLPPSQGFTLADTIFMTTRQFVTHDVFHARFQIRGGYEGLPKLPTSSKNELNASVGHLDAVRVNEKLKRVLARYLNKLVKSENERRYIDAIIFTLVHENGYSYTIFLRHYRWLLDLLTKNGGVENTELLRILKETNQRENDFPPMMQLLIEIIEEIEKNENTHEMHWIDKIYNELLLNPTESQVGLLEFSITAIKRRQNQKYFMVKDDLFSNPINIRILESLIVDYNAKMFKRVCDRFLTIGDSNSVRLFRNFQGKNLLHIAAECGSYDHILYLKTLNVPANVEDGNGKTPLEYFSQTDKVIPVITRRSILLLLCRGLSEAQLYKAIENAKKNKDALCFKALNDKFKENFPTSTLPAIEFLVTPALSAAKSGIFAATKETQQLPGTIEIYFNSLKAEFARYELMSKKCKQSILQKNLFNTRLFADFIQKMQPFESLLNENPSHSDLADKYKNLKNRTQFLNDKGVKRQL